MFSYCRSYLCLAASLFPACGGSGVTTLSLEVEGVLPRSATTQSGRGTRADPEPLWLNSKITVTFSVDIDPLSVTADTVRMVKLTPGGPQLVKMARRHIRRRSVDLIPEWPVSADLDEYVLCSVRFPVCDRWHLEGHLFDSAFMFPGPAYDHTLGLLLDSDVDSLALSAEQEVGLTIGTLGRVTCYVNT